MLRIDQRDESSLFIDGTVINQGKKKGQNCFLQAKTAPSSNTGKIIESLFKQKECKNTKKKELFL